MRIFVTGGRGFIGSHLIPMLITSGHEVLSLERVSRKATNFQILVGDLNQADSYHEALRRFKPECAVHLAWEALPDYSIQNCRKNLVASIDLLGSLRQIECNRVFVGGTCWEYGNQIGCLKEDSASVKPSIFAAHKIALNAIGQSIWPENEMDFIWGRLFFVYGPGQRPSSLIPAVYRNLADGITPKVKNSDALNDFIYVTDAVSAIKLLLESSNSSGIYNIGSGVETPVWKVVNIISSILSLPACFPDFSIHQEAGLSADISKLQSLGWQPLVSIEAGISKTIQSWKN